MASERTIRNVFTHISITEAFIVDRSNKLVAAESPHFRELLLGDKVVGMHTAYVREHQEAAEFSVLKPGSDSSEYRETTAAKEKHQKIHTTPMSATALISPCFHMSLFLLNSIMKKSII